jgi:5-methylcytosine-specific restriction endonuclease McrBC regulatory subunit McrC
MNMPFAGKVAYSTREYAYDNHVTQLIRHTIEFISNHPYGGGILKNDDLIKDAVTLIREATPSYSQNERRKVINQNLRPLSHPYFGEYRYLQRLCIQILRHEEIKYGHNDDEIYGVLFDGAWLWEEYLNTILRDSGYIHPQNKISKGRIYLFDDRSGERYPDFYKDDIVLDAKYKRYADMKLQNIDGDDLHQVITYMYILAAKHGGFIVPRQHNHEENTSQPKTLKGFGGRMNIYSITVDSPAENYRDYSAKMRQNEMSFVNQLRKDTKPKGWEVSLKELITSMIEDGMFLIDIDRNRALYLLNSSLAMTNLINDKIVDVDEAEKYVNKKNGR